MTPAGPAGSPQQAAGWVGRSVLRVEDRPLLTGNGSFVDDVDRPGQLVARIVRSDAAYGRIRGIDATAARARPGVVCVLTAEDIPDVRIPVRMMPADESVPVTQPPLAREIVRYVGEPVAVVVATDAYVAEDAADDVVLDVERLDPILDAHTAAAPEAPVLHADAWTGNVISRLSGRHGEDVAQLLEAADVVVSDRLRVHRHGAIPMETRGLVAEHDATTGRMTVWGPTKVKHFNRAIMSRLLDLPEDAIRFVEPDVGGGFGARGEFYPEDFLVPLLAMRLGRPVKWVEDRREHFMATNHAREVWCDLDIAAAADGTLLGFRAHCLVDQGAYARTHGTHLLPWVLVYHLAGPYDWRGFEVRADSILSNKTPSGTYRGPSQYESAFFRERMIDRVASVLDADPMDLRARNLIRTEAMPVAMDLGNGGMPLIYDGGDFPRVLDDLARRSAYAGLRAEQRRRRAAGELVGIGLSAHVEAAAFGRFEHARIATEGDGFVVYAGVASLGQGVRTILAQIAADALRVPVDRVTIVHHDTDLVPEGLGAYASRATMIGGGAVLGAADELLRRALATAAERLEISERDLEVVEGGLVRPKGQPSGGIALAELGCEGSCRYDKPLPTFDMGAMLALVAVDAATGGVSVERLVICHDVGRSVNPMLVDGQLVGAAAQGIGGTLLEELAYDQGGQPLSTSFMDYLLPTAAEIPSIEAYALDMPHHDPETEHPLGVKGVGESGIVGAGAAIANAVADAIGRDEGVSQLPLAPASIAALTNWS